MVFLSTLQALFGRPLSRSVFAFGTRQLTQRILVEELILGSVMVFPLSLLVAALTIRIAAAGLLQKPRTRRLFFFKNIRSDVFTTILITIVGDIFLEILLPSLQCLPTHHPTDTNSNLTYSEWLLQTWGFHCPEVSPTNSTTAATDNTTRTSNKHLLLSTDAVGTLLTIRLIFMCLGIYLGESFLPVALTGGIATGKSTVSQMLLDPSSKLQQTQQHAQQPQHQRRGSSGGLSSSTGSTGSASKSRKRKPKSALLSGTAGASSTSGSGVGVGRSQGSGGGIMSSLENDEEGSFLIVDTDRIAHEILLPPSVLKGDIEIDHNSNSNNNNGRNNGNGTHGGSSGPFMVQPQDSVYQTILDTFGEDDDDVDHDGGDEQDDDDGENKYPNSNILDDSNHLLIDRRKLGAIIFENPTARRQLNRITHPRIILIMLKQILYGIFWSPKDVVCADVPLLFESGQLRWLFGIIILVACDKETQFERLRKRNPDLTEQQCWDRINCQMPIDKKVPLADIVIWNNGDCTLEQLAEEVERVRRDVMGRMYGIGMSLLQMLLLVGGSLSLAVSSKLFSSWS